MKNLEAKLGYSFQNRQLLEHALTHSSYANEHKGEGLTSNERLEFLGDSVLGMVVADHLYRTHPNMPEGELTRTRAALVCEGSLHEVARGLGLGTYLRLGKGEDAGGGRTRPSILADAVESVLAAVYLDGGIAQVRRLIRVLILDREVERRWTGITRPPFRSWCSGKTARCFATAPWGNGVLTTRKFSRWRWTSTVRARAAARAGPKKRPSRWPPKRRWKNWRNESFCRFCLFIKRSEVIQKTSNTFS